MSEAALRPRPWWLHLIVVWLAALGSAGFVLMMLAFGIGLPSWEYRLIATGIVLISGTCLWLMLRQLKQGRSLPAFGFAVLPAPAAMGLLLAVGGVCSFFGWTC
jgi:hypothetical protein